MNDQKRVPAQALAKSRTAGHKPQIIDVRSPGEFDSGHLPGATNIPMESIESRLPDIDLAAPTILVCQSGSRADAACRQFGHQFHDIAVLEGGTQAWIASGEAVVRTTRSGRSLQQQSLLAAGVVNAIGVLLAIFVHPAWIGLNAFVSLGLMLAGSTGFCLMAILLALMPWNRRPRTLSCNQA